MNNFAARRTMPWALAAGLCLLLVAGGIYYVTRANHSDAEAISDASSSPQAPVSPNATHVKPAQKPALQLAESDLDLHPQLKNLKYDATIREIAKHEDPVVDGWDTERFNELADKQLKAVGKLIGNDREVAPQKLSQVALDRFRGEIRPSQLEPIYKDARFHVFRATEHAAPSAHDFPTALHHQADLFRHTATSRFKFKIIRVELEGTVARTTSYFQMLGYAESPWEQSDIGLIRRVQVNSTWECVWDLTDNETPKLASIQISDYEEVFSAEPPLFTDGTESQFEGITAFQDQLIHGRDHWYANLESSIGVEGRGNGLAIGDANGDGLEDLYICQPAALPNKLLLRTATGKFTDISAKAGVDWLDSSRGALFVDLDNDGDQDLVVSLSSEILLHENRGDGTFHVRATIRTNSRLFSINAVDYDRDGRLDIYACGYSGANQIRPEDIFASPVPYHDANNGAENRLLRQSAPWTFDDVTDAVGLGQNNLRFSLASCWDDFDRDGDPDLYVANDFGRNNLYRNDEGTFVDVAAEAEVEDIGPGMSCAWGDYNNDGLVDLYVSNMFSSAGSRITHTSMFKPDASTDDIAGFRRHARGNTLFENQGDGTFADQALASGTSMGRWAWGSLLVDVNNDGWRDIYVTNGFVTADNNNDL